MLENAPTYSSRDGATWLLLGHERDHGESNVVLGKKLSYSSTVWGCGGTYGGSIGLSRMFWWSLLCLSCRWKHPYVLFEDGSCLPLCRGFLCFVFGLVSFRVCTAMLLTSDQCLDLDPWMKVVLLEFQFVCLSRVMCFPPEVIFLLSPHSKYATSFDQERTRVWLQLRFCWVPTEKCGNMIKLNSWLPSPNLQSKEICCHWSSGACYM